MAEKDPVLNQEQHEALVASAVEAAVTETQTEVEAEVLRLTTELDEANTALAGSQEKVSELETANVEREQLADEAELADTRAKLVSEIAAFTDEQLEVRKESWGKLTEEEFDSQLASYQEIVDAAKANVNGGGNGAGGAPAPKTKLEMARASDGDTGDSIAVVRQFFGGTPEPADK